MSDLPVPSAEGLSLERGLLDAYARRSLEALEPQLAPEFRELASSGEIHDREAVLRSLPSAPEQRFELELFSARPLADGVMLHTYRATVHRGDRPCPSRSWRTSIWRRSGERWLLVFHQGSRIPDPGA